MPDQPKITGIKACVFDAYGTLFDVHSAVGNHRERLGDVADNVSVVWRTKQLEYTWLRSLMGRHADFWQVTREALEFAFEMHGVKDSELSADLMEAYLQLTPHNERQFTNFARPKASAAPKAGSTTFKWNADDA